MISFQNAKFNPNFSKTESNWAITTWQLLIHNFLTENIWEWKIVRVLSEKDSKYKDQAAKLMKLAKISIENIDDDEIISTTKLIETHWWEILYKAKIQNYLN